MLLPLTAGASRDASIIAALEKGPNGDTGVGVAGSYLVGGREVVSKRAKSCRHQLNLCSGPAPLLRMFVQWDSPNSSCPVQLP